MLKRLCVIMSKRQLQSFRDFENDIIKNFTVDKTMLEITADGKGDAYYTLIVLLG